jgi:hypothetical protein
MIGSPLFSSTLLIEDSKTSCKNPPERCRHKLFVLRPSGREREHRLTAQRAIFFSPSVGHDLQVQHSLKHRIRHPIAYWLLRTRALSPPRQESGRSPTLLVSGTANDVIVTRSAYCAQRNALAMPGRKEVRRRNSSPIII